AALGRSRRLRAGGSGERRLGSRETPLLRIWSCSRAARRRSRSAFPGAFLQGFRHGAAAGPARPCRRRPPSGPPRGIPSAGSVPDRPRPARPAGPARRCRSGASDRGRRSSARAGGRGRLHGRWIDAHGRSHRIGISSQDLLGALVEGDLEPILRSEFPAAARSAAGGDTAALARLLHRAESLEEKHRETPNETFDGPLYYTTICEEGAFPWSRGASPQIRRREAGESVRAL